MTNELIVTEKPFTLQKATIRHVYTPSEVERRLEKIVPERHNEGLRNMYERMLARGAERFQVKPAGVPNMADMYGLLPNFHDVLDEVRRCVALSQDSCDGLEISPMLLLGPPGVGKTHFAKKIADLIGTDMCIAQMSSMTAGWILSGSSSQWQAAKPGKVFQAIVDGQYANPVMLVDEIDKASLHAQYDPLGALYGLLEHDSAQTFIDEFADVPIDASQIIWVTTANNEHDIPLPIRNRMTTFEINEPTRDQARMIALHLYREILSSHDWGKKFVPEPNDDSLDCLAVIGPREMRKALMAGFGNARLNKRYEVLPEDFPTPRDAKKKIGFV